MSRDAQREAQRQAQRKKQLRKNTYHDLQVQGTNNSSIVSKRSVEQLYTPVVEPELGEWFKYFVPKAKRRSPAINRGYWIRMEVIKRTVLNIIAANPGKSVAVVNLGCGFDPLPFQLFSVGIDVTVYDVDYPDLIARKKAMMEASEEIEKVLKDHRYELVGCDLNHPENYAKLVSGVAEEVVIFIAEVSLAYMKPEEADTVISLSAKLPGAHFLILEQIMPLGEETVFAKKMIHHFDHLRHPLQSIEQYNTRPLQNERFGQWFEMVESKDLFEIWRDYIDDGTKEKVASVEPFDEFEEFILFCHHYLVTHASHQNKSLFGPLPQLPQPLPSVSNSWVAKPSIDLKFPACCVVDDKVLLHGGLGQSRTDATIYDGQKLDIASPSPRMNHVLVSLGSRAILIGGRARPTVDYDDVWEFTGTWRQLPSLPFTVSRHSAVAISATTILIVSSHGIATYNATTGETEIVNSKLKRSSAGLIVNENGTSATVVGGMTGLTPVTANTLDTIDLATFSVTEVAASPHFARIGAQLAWRNNQLLVIGGTNSVGLDADVVYVEDSKVVSQQQLSGSMLMAHQVVTVNETIHIIGGGGVCYSFGNVYNPNYELVPV